VLFDFFKTLNTGEPENEGDPPVFNQDTDDLNNIINESGRFGALKYIVYRGVVY
jgi:hypothetical protein